MSQTGHEPLPYHVACRRSDDDGNGRGGAFGGKCCLTAVSHDHLDVALEQFSRESREAIHLSGGRLYVEVDLGIAESTHPVSECFDIIRMDDTARQPADSRRRSRLLLRPRSERRSEEAARERGDEGAAFYGTLGAEGGVGR